MDITKLFLAFTKDYSMLVTALIFFWLIYGWMVYHSLKYDGKGRTYFLNPIKKQSFENYYHKKLKHLLNYTAEHFFKDHKRIKAYRKQPKIHRIAKWGLFNTYSGSSYDFLLRLALTYPIFFVFLIWLFTSQGGEIGGFKLLNDGIGVFQRIQFIGSFCYIIYSFWKFANSSGVKHKFQNFSDSQLESPRIELFLYLVAFVVASAVVVDFVGASASASIFVFVFVFVFAGTFASAGTIIFAVFFGYAVTDIIAAVGFISPDFLTPVYIAVKLFFSSVEVVILSFGGDYIYRKFKKYDIQLFFWLGFHICFVCYLLYIIYWLGRQESTTETLSILIFLGLLPLINAPFDWVSLGVTRSLLYSIVDKVHGGVIAFFWSVFDIVIALILLLGIVSSSTVIISMANYLYQQGGNYGPILDLNIIFSDLRVNVFNAKYYWLYGMFLSTLLPTAIHLILASWSVFMWIPTKIMKWLRKGWKKDQLKYNLPKLLSATAYYTLFLPVAIVAPFLVLYGLHVLLIQYGYAAIFGEGLLENMNELAHWVNPLMDKKL